MKVIKLMAFHSKVLIEEEPMHERAEVTMDLGTLL